MQDRSTRLGGALVACGSAAVVVITAIYASAPTAASAPLPATLSVAEALAGTLAAAGRLRVAGMIGIVGDVMLIGGCALLALRSAETPLKRVMWTWLGLSTALFMAVDGLATVLPDVAGAAGTDLGAFTLGKRTFDFCFTLGVFTFGAAFVAVAAENSLPRWLRMASLAAGTLSVAAFLLHATGTTLPLLFGAAVGFAALLGVAFGYREVRA